MVTMFDRNGVFVMPSDAKLATLSPGERERLEAVHVAADAVKAGEQKVKAAVDKVQAAIERINKVDLLLKNYPPPSRIELARASSTFAADMARLKR